MGGGGSVLYVLLFSMIIDVKSHTKIGVLVWEFSGMGVGGTTEGKGIGCVIVCL